MATQLSVEVREELAVVNGLLERLNELIGRDEYTNGNGSENKSAAMELELALVKRIAGHLGVTLEPAN